MYGLQLEKINLKNNTEVKKVRHFLNNLGLDYDDDVDHTFIYRENGEIKATASKSGSILKCFGISPEFRGEGITAVLVSALIDRLGEEGIFHSFIFTTSANINIFTSLGYKVIHGVKDAVLLENGIFNIDKYLERLSKKYKLENKTPRSALVMNCNPFTLGHKYIIETACRNSEQVLVFIVQEDRSLFPFNIRYDLVRRGTQHLKNLEVIPGGEYIISSATFPSYFLREDNERMKAYTELDAGIFGKYFCSRFNIKVRYVGSEPYCNVTREYNAALRKVLCQFGVELKEIERMRNNNDFISASIVRNLIKCDKLEDIKKFLPEVTINFLNSSHGKEIMEKIKETNSPH